MSEARSLPGGAHAEMMQTFLAGLEIPYGIERSAKWRPQRWSTDRLLCSTPVAVCGADVLARQLPALLERLGMQHTDMQAFLAELRPTVGEVPHYLHLGVEDGRCKVYWEASQPEQLAQESRFVLYRAWKWQPGEAAALSEYVLEPSAGQAVRAIKALLAEMPMALADLLEQLEVSFALKQTPWPPLTVRIEEHMGGRETQRHSLNLHLHQARLPLGGIAGLCMGLVREWQSAPRSTVVEWVAAHGSEMLGNLSFGIGDDGQPFLTCYHGARLCKP